MSVEKECPLQSDGKCQTNCKFYINNKGCLFLSIPKEFEKINKKLRTIENDIDGLPH